MGLADDLERFGSQVNDSRPTIDRVLYELPDGERAALLDALRSQMPHKTIAKALSANGWKCSDRAVAGWRDRNGWQPDPVYFTLDEGGGDGSG